MTVGIRLSTGATVVPVKLTAGETIIESAVVHAGAGFVVLDPGATSFTVRGKPVVERSTTLRHFERRFAVVELPTIVASETEMDDLRTRWENVDAFYRRVTDEQTRSYTPERTVHLSEVRAIAVDTAEIPAAATGWTPAPDYLGVPAPLSALVPGTLSRVPELVAEALAGRNLRVSVRGPLAGKHEASVIVDFTVAFSDARTKLVKKDPFNNRRNAKRVSVVDTKYVQLTAPVPTTVAADTLALAHSKVAALVADIASSIDEPVTVCASCAGAGLILGPQLKERH